MDATIQIIKKKIFTIYIDISVMRMRTLSLTCSVVKSRKAERSFHGRTTGNFKVQFTAEGSTVFGYV